MIKGVGTDIAKVDRMTEKLGKKVLTGNEEYRSGEHFAGLWAAKEAVLKAMGCGISSVSFQDIEIVYDSLGAPKVLLSSNGLKKLKAMEGERVHISISHEKEYAVAFAIIE